MTNNEFLNWIADRLVNVYGESPNVDFVHKLRALAQPEQEPTNLERHERNVQKFLGTQQPKEPEQEPSYWLGYGLQAHTERPFDDATPLYTTPQQRTWVGLTDDERIELYKKFTDSDEWTYEKAIEAKLKEKNT